MANGDAFIAMNLKRMIAEDFGYRRDSAV